MMDSDARQVAMVCWRCAIAGRIASMTGSSTSRSATRPHSSRNLPALARAPSSRSSTRRARWLTWRLRMPCTCPSSPSFACACCSSSVAMRIGFNGLRSSCATIARNITWRRWISSAFVCSPWADTTASTRCSFASRRSASRPWCHVGVGGRPSACGPASLRDEASTGGANDRASWNSPWPPPCALARYIALSAQATSSAPDSASCG